MTGMAVTMLAGVEMGGTKCVCTLGTGPDDIRAQVTLPTLDPNTTLDSIAAVLQKWLEGSAPPTALGVASFGPIDLRRHSPTYGRMGATPKRGWPNTDIAGYFIRRFGLPVGISTDVIGAALAEGRWGDARGLTDFVYITVGTGIGAGIVVGGKSVYGCHHPEVGHLRLVRAMGDTWPGNCPFHGDCVEGLASGPAIAARSGQPGDSLPADNPVWDTVAHTLALRNKNVRDSADTWVLQYTRPDSSRIVLSGFDTHHDSVYVVLDRTNKKYLLEEAAGTGRTKNLKL